MSKIKHDKYVSYQNGKLTYESYAAFRNSYNGLIKRCKVNYFKEKFNCALGNIRETWNTINNLMGSKSVRTIMEINQNGTLISDPQNISNLFSEYFSSVPKKLVDLIPVSQVSHLSFLEQNPRMSFQFQICTNSEVQKTICNLKNKSCRNDKIPVFIYKELKDIISPVICKLFNSSLLDGYFPNI